MGQRVDGVGLTNQDRGFEVARHPVEDRRCAPDATRVIGGAIAGPRQVDVEVEGDPQHQPREQHDGEYFEQGEAGAAAHQLSCGSRSWLDAVAASKA
jgi:hypothetical protein